MLDIIRSGAQSWGVKVVFGIIILVFIFWGVGNMGGRSPNAVATVNGEEITLRALAQRYQETVEQLRRKDPKFSVDDKNSFEIKRAVLSEMVVELIRLQEAKRLGLFVSPNEVLQVIGGIGAFQDAQGKFSPEKYKEVLARTKQSPGAYEEHYRNLLMQEKFDRYIAMSAGITEAEARNEFDFMLEQRTAEYVLFPVTAYKDKVTVADAEIAAYYDTNKENFRTPVLVNLEYLTLTPASLAAGYPVSDAEIADYYAKHQAEFTEPDKFQVRHIYLRCPPDGSNVEGGQAMIDKAKAALAEIEKQLAAKADFGALAKKYSEDKATADLGGMMPWLEKGQVGVPAFDEAAETLKVGEISKPVRTDFGFHIIKMEGRMPSAVKPLADVKADIAALLGKEKATADFTRVQNIADDGLNAGTPLADLAKTLHAGLADTGLVKMEEAVSKLGLQSESRKNLEDAVNGMVPAPVPAAAPSFSATAAVSSNATAAVPSSNATAVASSNATAAASSNATVPAVSAVTIPVPLNVADGIVLVRIKDVRPSRIPDLAEKRADIVAALSENKAVVMAHKAAEEALPSFTGSAVPSAFAGKTAETDKFNRVYPFFGPLGSAPGLAEALFSVKKGEWLPSVYDTGAGTVIARVDSVIPAPAEEWEKLRPRMMESRLRDRQEAAVRAYLQNVFAGADIKEAPNLQEQLNMFR